MGHWFAIASGGACGALMRYWLVSWIQPISDRFIPWGTLLVNVSGSLLAGLLYVLLVERLQAGNEWRGLLQIGFLGAFTTFSAFSLETVQLFENGRVSQALLYTLLSVVLCVVAAWLGILWARSIFTPA